MSRVKLAKSSSLPSSVKVSSRGERLGGESGGKLGEGEAPRLRRERAEGSVRIAFYK